jgi:hypothetical protein
MVRPFSAAQRSPLRSRSKLVELNEGHCQGGYCLPLAVEQLLRVAHRDERIQDREIGPHRRCRRGARIRIFRADRLDEDDVLAGPERGEADALRVVAAARISGRERLARPMAKKPMFIDSPQTSEKR